MFCMDLGPYKPLYIIIINNTKSNRVVFVIRDFGGVHLENRRFEIIAELLRDLKKVDVCLYGMKVFLFNDFMVLI